MASDPLYRFVLDKAAYPSQSLKTSGFLPFFTFLSMHVAYIKYVLRGAGTRRFSQSDAAHLSISLDTASFMNTLGASQLELFLCP